ncbi:hypothetical protein Cch01nite_18780 [Cellulomonas chitinilytica]|uniref:AFP-like domain-containing protein n=1 Tax=Cellulomonas chitinilytica TaxID=398759 RepID=A0A919P4D1_9CELL|nr:SAF domain-containing protein [Cellulomonas chitinilytica]GIG21154.1 hypothetical protein Cch01nite_18780 [Cellulomonas chitinilytica]
MTVADATGGPRTTSDRGVPGSLVSEVEATPLVPSPPKGRRRWGLFSAMVLVVCLGALGNVWLHASTSTAQPVVAARSTIERGTLIGRDQLMTVRIDKDLALRTVPGAGLDSLVGQRASLDVAAGSLITAESVTAENIPSEGHSLVGVAVSTGMLPGVELVSGDEVQVVTTQDPLTATDGAAATPVTTRAVVVSEQTGVQGSNGTQTVVTVQVPTVDAPQLAAASATGTVAIVLDSRDR